jgi:quinol-cytochrome oxidoreductase complex cytochrome b subunit
MDHSKTERTNGLFDKLVDWMDERFQVRSLVQSMLHVNIPRSAKTYYLGGITMFLFIVQVITGSLLALYYQPTPNNAYDSVMFIMSNVNFGWLIRSIHSWSANLMIICAILHLLRIYFQGVYKRPRELTWVVGGLLLIVTLGFGFTGYLLPWDQRAYWASTVGTGFAGAIPVVGDFALSFIRGGADITEATLSRFYGAHTLWLPMILAGMLLVHLVLIHQQGIASRKRLVPTGKSETQPAPEPGEKSVPFFPHYILSEGIAWYIVLGILIILASLWPVGLEGKADSLQTPAHIKPEWYFLAFYQLLKFVPRVVGVITPMIALPILVLLPFFDRNPEIDPRRRIFAIIFGVVILVFLIAFTIWGYVS